MTDRMYRNYRFSLEARLVLDRVRGVIVRIKYVVMYREDGTFEARKFNW